MVEPSYGYAGTLDMLSRNRPSEGGSSLYSAASELSSAARIMQMSQGGVSNQTQAIAAMAQQQQQQSQQIAQLISGLSFNISQLSSAVAQSVGAQRAASLATPPLVQSTGGFMPGGFGHSGMSAFNPMPMMSALGGGAMAAGRLFAGGANLAMRGIGYAGGAMASPFLGGQYMGPGAGQMMGTFGNAGFARSFAGGMGLNMGLRPGQFAMGTEAAADRAGFKAGEIAIGAGAGIMNLGGSVIGGLGRMGGLAGGLGGMLGGALGGQMGPVGGALGTIGGTALGGFAMGGPAGAAAALAGLAITKAVEATVGKIVEKAGEIRGSGEMFGRNAFRMGGSRRMSQVDRTQFGVGMSKMATEDLTYNMQDLQEIMAGGIENDMFRGVNGARQAQQRMRELKDTVKTISQTLGTSIRESMDVMNSMQGLGIAPSGQMSAILSGSTIQGMTRGEALQGSMSFSNRFAGTGFQGRGLFNLGTQSQGLGQTAMRMGLLSSEQIAAVGGRQGVGQVMGNVTMGLAQSGLGTMNMAAAMRRGHGGVSGNAMSALSQAGGAGGASDLVDFAANKSELMRDAINDPAFRLNMLAQVSSIADQFAGQGTKKNRMKLALKSFGIDGAEAGVFMAMMEAEPQAQRDRLNELQRARSDLQANQIAENYDIGALASRKVGRVLGGPAAAVARGAATLGDAVNNTSLRMRNAIFGIGPDVSMRTSDVTAEAALASLSRTGVVGDAGVINSSPTSDDQKIAKDAVEALKIDGDSDLSTLQNTDNDSDKKTAASSLIQKLTQNVGDNSPEMKKALAMALAAATGQDVNGLLFGSGGMGASAERLAGAQAMNDALRSALTGGGETAAGVGLGAGIGMGIGALLSPFTGGASILAGGALGGYLGNKVAGNQFSDEDMNRVMRSPAALRMLKNKQKLASGNLSAEEAAKVRQEINADKASLSGEGTSDNIIQRLDSLSGGSLDAAVKTIVSGAADAASLGFDLSLQGGMSAARMAAEEAGLGGLSTQLSGGVDNLGAVLSSIAGLSGEDRESLKAHGGDALIKAASINSSMTDAQLQKILGTDAVLNKDGTVNVAASQRKIIAASGAMDSNRAAGVGSSAFTAEQTRAQVQLSAQIQQTASLLKDTVQVIEAMKLKGK